jgi:hypothetical protein
LLRLRLSWQPEIQLRTSKKNNPSPLEDQLAVNAETGGVVTRKNGRIEPHKNIGELRNTLFLGEK